MSTAQKEMLVIVTPVYEDTQASNRLFQELAEAFNKQVFVVAVDGGSVQELVDIVNTEKPGIIPSFIILVTRGASITIATIHSIKNFCSTGKMSLLKHQY